MIRTIILFIIVFGLVVISHELGHFLIGRKNGIRVVEFAVGMGPTLFSFMAGGTKCSLKLLPFGGACMFEGEDGMEREENAERAQEESGEGVAFTEAGVWARIATVFAGPFFNFILAFIIAVILCVFTGADLPVVGTVMENSAASEAGLQQGDVITRIGHESIHFYREVSMISALNHGETMEIAYERNGEKNVEYWVKLTYKSLAMLVKGQVTKDDVTGPVGIAQLVGESYDQAEKDYGTSYAILTMLQIVVLLSVNLGIMNLLPIPALDGGRLVFMLVEVVRGKPVPPEKEGMVHFAGLVVLMALMVFIMYNDIMRLLR